MGESLRRMKPRLVVAELVSLNQTCKDSNTGCLATSRRECVCSKSQWSEFEVVVVNKDSRRSTHSARIYILHNRQLSGYKYMKESINHLPPLTCRTRFWRRPKGRGSCVGTSCACCASQQPEGSWHKILQAMKEEIFHERKIGRKVQDNVPRLGDDHQRNQQSTYVDSH